MIVPLLGQFAFHVLLHFQYTYTATKFPAAFFGEMYVAADGRRSFNGTFLSTVTAVKFDSKLNRLHIVRKQPKAVQT